MSVQLLGVYAGHIFKSIYIYPFLVLLFFFYDKRQMSQFYSTYHSDDAETERQGNHFDVTILIVSVRKYGFQQELILI